LLARYALALLLQNESFIEFLQNPVSRQELNFATVARIAAAKNLRHEVAGDFLGLSRQDAEGEFAKLRSGVLEEELREHHPGGKRVDENFAAAPSARCHNTIIVGEGVEVSDRC